MNLVGYYYVLTNLKLLRKIIDHCQDLHYASHKDAV